MGSSRAYWYVNHYIVFVHNVGDLTTDDFRKVDQQIVALMRESADVNHDRKVHVLVDSTEMRKLPRLTELEGGRILTYMKEPNCGWTVVVGYRTNPLLSVLSRFLTSVMGANLYMADTLSKGISLFRQLDPAMPDLPEIEAWKQTHTNPTAKNG